jgi:hypothetical protein
MEAMAGCESKTDSGRVALNFHFNPNQTDAGVALRVASSYTMQ